MFMKETESGKRIYVGRIIGALVIIAIIVLAVKLIKNRIEMYKYYHTYHTGGSSCTGLRWPASRRIMCSRLRGSGSEAGCSVFP